MAIHQSNKWDIATLNQVLDQLGIRFTRALNLAPPAGPENTNSSGLNLSVHVCACECCLVWTKTLRNFYRVAIQAENILAELQ